MERIRKPFQGVLNIFRFNWHYFVISIGMLLLLLFVSNFYATSISFFINTLCLLAFIAVLVSLVVSFYVYDLSNLYSLDWIDFDDVLDKQEVINISAGFDETTVIIDQKFKNAKVQAFDFYDERKHTEVSIKRARKAYPPFPNTIEISTSKLPLQDNSIDKIFLILAAHEIRDSIERTLFFAELNRVLRQNGKIILTEHLQDLPNFFAYNIGAFHFHKREDWLINILNSKLKVNNEISITPFITTFILEKNGNSS